jgi:Hemerythrin HHE cation binding domain
MSSPGTSEAPFGVMLHRRLKLVHQMLRKDLAVCRDLASEVAAGASPGRIAEQIAALKTNSPIWTLRVNCLYHCRLVHLHHQLEGADMFPALRRSNPALSAVVDRLEADHRTVSTLLDDVEASVADLDDLATSPARELLVRRLTQLADHLLAHLAYEEETVATTMRGWERWPD